MAETLFTDIINNLGKSKVKVTGSGSKTGKQQIEGAPEGITSDNRITELQNILEEVDGKVIIWAIYRHDIKEITNLLSEKYGKDSVASFFGDTADSDRQDIVTRFQDRESPLRFFVGNPRTGGYGLTLTASNTVVYYSNSYDLEIRLQSEDRAHRISQTKKVTYIDLISEGTVDEFIVKNLRGKINLATKVLGEEFKKWLI